MATREAFIEGLRAALGHRERDPYHGSAEIPEDYENALKAIQNRDRAGRIELLDLMTRRAELQNITVRPVSDAVAAGREVAELVRDKKPEWGETKQVAAWEHPIIDALQLPVALQTLKVPVAFTKPVRSDADRSGMRRQINDCFIGITAADYGVAETATLVLKTRPGRPRSVSLLPAIHIAVIPLDSLVKNTRELYAMLKWHPEAGQRGLGVSTTFITGPSKTADIEATLVHGAHGPKELHIFVVTGAI